MHIRPFAGMKILTAKFLKILVISIGIKFVSLQ
jgi:hypothetical protein